MLRAPNGQLGKNCNTVAVSDKAVENYTPSSMFHQHHVRSHSKLMKLSSFMVRYLNSLRGNKQIADQAVCFPW